MKLYSHGIRESFQIFRYLFHKHANISLSYGPLKGAKKKKNKNNNNNNKRTKVD